MAAGGGEKPEREMVRLVAGFALVHRAVALVIFLLLEEHGANVEHFCQCMEACPLLSIVEACSTMFHHPAHVTTAVCSVVQMLLAALALVSTGRLRRAVSFVAICITVATGMLSIRLVYTALFGTHCCFSGGTVQIAFAVAVVFTQAAIPFCGGMVAAACCEH